MALTDQRLWWGIRASGTPSRVGQSGSTRLGVKKYQFTNLTNSDVGYAFKLTAGGAGVARLDWTTGQVTLQSGSVTIEDEGVDAEGETLPTMTHINGVHLSAGVVTGTIDVASSVASLPQRKFARTGKHVEVLNTTDGALTGETASGTVDITFTTSGDSITVFVLADTNA